MQLTAQRDQAITAATEPINRKYKEGLELLLRRATQASDLDAALRIRQTLGGVATAPGVPTPLTPPSPPATSGISTPSKVGLTKHGLENELARSSTWVTKTNSWLQTMIIEKGKVIHNPNKDGVGRTASFHAVDGVTIVYQWDGKPCTITFSPDLKICTRNQTEQTEYRRK